MTLSTPRRPPFPEFKQVLKQAPIALLALAALIGFSCGKRGAPIPPRERVAQRVQLDGFQRGNQIILSWKMPARNAPKKSVLNISRADIYRLAEPVTSPQQLSEEEFANRSTLIAAMPISDADFGVNRTLQYKDELEFAGQAARLRYAVRFVNASGQKAAFSNTLLIEPAGKIAAAPAQLSAEASQDAIRLKWQPPANNIDQSAPASVIGYNIYRSASMSQPAKLLNKAPVTGTEFADEFFDFGKEYYYFVRAVSAGVQTEPVESAESNVLKFKAVDTFPEPAVGDHRCGRARDHLDLFAVNPEKDIIGYRVYRSEQRDLPLDKWTQLTPEILTKNTYQDTRVESGKTYFYYLTATDKAGNTSQPSEVVSETAP